MWVLGIELCSVCLRGKYSWTELSSQTNLLIFNQAVHLLIIEFPEFFAYFGQLDFIRCLLQMFAAHMACFLIFSMLSLREKNNISYFFHEF